MQSFFDRMYRAQSDKIVCKSNCCIFMINPWCNKPYEYVRKHSAAEYGDVKRINYVSYVENAHFIFWSFI